MRYLPDPIAREMGSSGSGRIGGRADDGCFDFGPSVNRDPTFAIPGGGAFGRGGCTVTIAGALPLPLPSTEKDGADGPKADAIAASIAFGSASRTAVAFAVVDTVDTVTHLRACAFTPLLSIFAPHRAHAV
ncbi:MAG: hypothetical protein ACREM8_14515 [Vulcanimicrobiaceae bacterium]